MAEAMRGIGRTELMIANLPKEQCTIVVPSRDIGREIAKMAQQVNPGHRRYVTVRTLADVQKLSGLSEPVFFDHSFYDHAQGNVAKAATEAALICARMGVWRSESANA